MVFLFLKHFIAQTGCCFHRIFSELSTNWIDLPRGRKPTPLHILNNDMIIYTCIQNNAIFTMVTYYTRLPYMNSQLVGTNNCFDIWYVLSNRPSVLPTKRHTTHKLCRFLFYLTKFISEIFRNLEAPQPEESQAYLITATLDNSAETVPKNWEWVMATYIIQGCHRHHHGYHSN